jgi:hypothetical protein
VAARKKRTSPCNPRTCYLIEFHLGISLFMNFIKDLGNLRCSCHFFDGWRLIGSRLHDFTRNRRVGLMEPVTANEIDKPCTVKLYTCCESYLFQGPCDFFIIREVRSATLNGTANSQTNGNCRSFNNHETGNCVPGVGGKAVLQHREASSVSEPVREQASDRGPRRQ